MARPKDQIKKGVYNFKLPEDLKRKLFVKAYGSGRRANELLIDLLEKALNEPEEQEKK